MSAALDILFHPVVLILIGIALLVLIFYLLKSFLKFVIIFLLVLFVSVIGYHYYHAEGKFNDRMKSALLSTKAQIGHWVDKGKEAAFWGKKIINQRQEDKADKQPDKKKEEPPIKKYRLKDVDV